MKDLCVELKVCEGCGTLWFRAKAMENGAGVYCHACSERLAEFPAVRRSRRGRKRSTVARTAVCVGGSR